MKTTAADCADVVAYVDEAGEKGLARNLTENRDHGVGLMCALAFPIERLVEWRGLFRPGFDRFKNAAPTNAKLHFTDAFKPGNEAWAEVARPVRDEFAKLIVALHIPVIYEARRLGVQRKAHELVEKLKEAAKLSRRSRIQISDHPSDELVEEWLITGMALKLDALAQDCGRQQVDLYFDEIDRELAKRYEISIQSTRTIGRNQTVVKGWDPEQGKPVVGTIQIQAHAGFELDVKHIGKVRILGKDDPLILATDSVANSLHHHLRNLSNDAFLNRPASIADWLLSQRVYGVRNDASEDLI